jgi:hypothetical protein
LRQFDEELGEGGREDGGRVVVAAQDALAQRFLASKLLQGENELDKKEKGESINKEVNEI